uniref:MarR family transcriptional regulator n=1 Tax=Peptoniphilus grossensis TaxID=1465756 RepID=UPI00288B5A5C|nr:MarR family transcriptional regulator [Peptoniphilus grossensis]
MNKNIFGIPVKYEEWKYQDYLPVYIMENYDIYQANIGNTRCIMLKPLEELTTLPALKKQIKKIQTIDNVPVVLELDTVTSYRKQSLIENNISFITNKQLYLPFIGAMLMDEEETKKPPKKFVYSTQQLFLYYLYNNEKRIYVSDARRHLPYTAMTLTRAVKQLEATNLFYIDKNGVNKFIESKYSRKDLFTKAKPYLSTPVIKTGFIDKTRITEDMVFSGETALSKKTMLNSSRVVTYAINEKDYDKTLLQEELIDPDKSVKLELWAYDPNKFSRDTNADDISVILSFKGTADERIEEAIDDLQESELQN